MRRAQALYIVLDGLGDEPHAGLGGRTPLQVARTPVLDALAHEGEVYRLRLTDREGNVATNIGQFALLGYEDSRTALPQRGPVEAAATGLELEAGDVALRANLATLDERGLVVDRRAGRIREGAEALCEAVDGMDLGDGVLARVRCATEHRAAVVLRGAGLDAQVTDSDPKSLASGPVPPLAVRPLAPAAERTAVKLEHFLARARQVLERHPVNAERRSRGLPAANALLTRQAGSHVALPSLEELYGLRCAGVAGERTVLGVLRLLRCKAVTKPEFTANVDTSLEGKFETALELFLEGFDVVLLHVKATDILGHDRRAHEKASYLEALDAHIGAALKLLPEGALVALGSDHSTSSTTGDHILAPVPALLWGPGTTSSGAAAFDEAVLANLGAPVLEGRSFFLRLLELLRGGRTGSALDPPDPLARLPGGRG